MSNVLVSIVIPTFGRPQYVNRAIKSALTYSGECSEVIVVPNGSDTSWVDALSVWENEPRVRISAIETAHANAARNHGLQLAEGKYIRFLDDDDYLLPGAESQLDVLIKSKKMVSIGAIKIIKKSSTICKQPPSYNKIIENITSAEHISLPFSFLFHQDVVKDLVWDESCNLAQDKKWLYEVAIKHNYDVVLAHDYVGCWVRHNEDGITNAHSLSKHATTRIEMIFCFYNKLVANHAHLCDMSRVSENVGTYIWNQIYSVYYTDYKYWDVEIERFNLHFSKCSPNVSAYKYLPLLKYVNKKTIFKLLAPIRKVRGLK